MTAALEFLATTKAFAGRAALDGLTLAVQPGEILGFLGPNGAGKTTAIHLALGFLRPTGGGGRILGRPFGDVATHRRIGFAPDVPVTFAGSAIDAMRLAGRLNRVSGPALEERSRALLERLELPAEEGDARKFSRGMQQRLGLAQALLNDPDLLILDEPTSALDPPTLRTVRELLREARAQGKAVFFSSHQLSEVEQVCDRIAFLNHGRLLKVGRLEELTGAASLARVGMRGLGRLPEKFSSSAAAAEDGVWRWTVPAGEVRALVEAGWAAGGELVEVEPVKKSLEELFVEWSGE